MKTKKLVKMVQSRINVKVDAKSKHFSSEVMGRQIEAPHRSDCPAYRAAGKESREGTARHS